MADIVKESEKKMQDALEHLKQELKALRTGRANPSMVEAVMVEVYGTQMRLTDIATVTVPDARQILITPFDKSNVHQIAKSIEKGKSTLQAVVDGTVVRIRVAEMNQSVRQEMVKQAHEKREKAKVAIRAARRDANNALRQLKSNGELPEDELNRQEKKIQEATDKNCSLVDQLTEQKEKEILTV